MSAPCIRPSAPGDETELKELWKRSFGDGDDFIELFFGLMYSPGSAAVLESDGKIVSAMYNISGLSYSAPGVTRDLPYAYALGTLPGYRGRGYGAIVCRALARAAFESGRDAVALLPSDGGLRKWYQKKLEAKTGFWIKELRLHPPFAQDKKCGLAPAAPELYNKSRESALEGRPHVSFCDRYIELSARAMEQSGGGLFLLGSADLEGCAAIERGKGGLIVKELLIRRGKIEAAALAIARRFPENELTIRCPAFQEGLECAAALDFAALIQAGSPVFPLAENAYFGLALD